MVHQARPDRGATRLRLGHAARALIASNLLPACIFGLHFPESDTGGSSSETSLSSTDISSSGDQTNTTSQGAESTAGPGSASDSGTTLEDTTGGASASTSGSSTTSESSGQGGTGSTGAPIQCPSDSDCTPGEPRCPTSCYRDRYAFVTSVTVKGYAIGGTDKADTLCNKLAVDAKLFTADESYKHPMRAWLSDTSDNAKGPVKFGKGRYFLPRTSQEREDGLPADDPTLLVADSFDALLLPSMTRPINRDELGFEHADYAWTNTDLAGTAISQAEKGTCNHWSMPCCINCACEGLVGDITAIDGKWTALSPPINFSNCGNEHHLYCFESLWDSLP